MPDESRGVLDGITVLEFSSYIAAPVAAVMLAEMGADVIKVERVETGDPFRGARTVLGVDQTLPGDRTVSYDLCNRSKRCIALNLEDQQGQELAHRLVERADVVLTNMSRGGAKRLGIDPETLSAVNPDLIYARLTAWGSRGPHADRKGMDYMMQGPSGLMWNTGDRDSEQPSRVASTILDGASAVTLVTAVLAALLNRELHGGGQQVSTSLLGTSLTLQRASVGNTLWLGQGISAHITDRGPKSDRDLLQVFRRQVDHISKSGTSSGLAGVRVNCRPPRGGRLAGPACPRSRRNAR